MFFIFEKMNEFDEVETPSVKKDAGTQVVKVGQEQIHGLLFGNQLSWQAIIYDLINTEQLDPWDIDISLLTKKYLEKVRELEETNLFVSSKVLFAASLLLRMKSEILLNYYIPNLDSILFGKKDEKKYVRERIELDEEIPELVPRSPLPRFRKVTLQELMSALGKAITTETRRIKRVVLTRQQEIETAIALPKGRINIHDKIKSVYLRLKEIFSKREQRVAFSEIAGATSEERIAHFVPLLHLDNQHKVFLEQDGHLEEIYIWLKSLHEKKNAAELKRLREEVEKALAEETGEEEVSEVEKVESGFDFDDVREYLEEYELDEIEEIGGEED